MNQNVIPALIVAGAIIAGGFFLQRATTQHAAAQLDAVLTRLESASQKGADGSDAQVTRTIKSLSRAMSDGFKAGMAESSKSSTDDEAKKLQEDFAVRDRIAFRGTKLLPSQQKTQERMASLVKNQSDKVLSNVQLQVTFQDKDGELLDLQSAYVSAPIRPGEEAAFECNRNLGEYKETDDVLAKRRAAKVVVKVIRFTATTVPSAAPAGSPSNPKSP